MKKNRVWLIVIIAGVMLITTVCYIASVKNARTQYANGRIVERMESEDEGRCSIY